MDPRQRPVRKHLSRAGPAPRWQSLTDNTKRRRVLNLLCRRGCHWTTSRLQENGETNTQTDIQAGRQADR
eukprot:4494823-Alexandrium_andersonii.AAC.1